MITLKNGDKWSFNNEITTTIDDFVEKLFSRKSTPVKWNEQEQEWNDEGIICPIREFLGQVSVRVSMNKVFCAYELPSGKVYVVRMVTEYNAWRDDRTTYEVFNSVEEYKQSLELKFDPPKQRLTYQSEGTDDMWIPCDTIEELINCFASDANALKNGEVPRRHNPPRNQNAHRARNDETLMGRYWTIKTAKIGDLRAILADDSASYEMVEVVKIKGSGENGNVLVKNKNEGHGRKITYGRKRKKTNPIP